MQFKRGDVVEYDVTGQRGMSYWKILNGRVGIIVSGPHKRTKEYGPRYWVHWISRPAEHRDIDDDGSYPVEFLRKLDHIELPAEDGGQEGEKP